MLHGQQYEKIKRFLISIGFVSKLVQLPKPSRNKPASKWLSKLETTCSWFSYNKLLEAILLVKPIPSSCNLYIHTFSTASWNARWRAQEFLFSDQQTKSLHGSSHRTHENQRFFHTCYHVWKHENMGYRIKFRGPLLLVILRVWSSIIFLCRILDVHLVFHTLFCPKMKPEPSVQSTLWISLILFEWGFVVKHCETAWASKSAHVSQWQEMIVFYWSILVIGSHGEL
jgi:hypothetical protein